MTNTSKTRLQLCIEKAEKEAGVMSREELEQYYLDRRADELFDQFLDSLEEGVHVGTPGGEA